MQFGNERESGQIEECNQQDKDQETPSRAQLALVPEHGLGAV
jgi:hypothetical protein